MCRKHRYGIIFSFLSFIMIFGFLFYLKINKINLDTNVLLTIFLISSVPFIILVGIFSKLIDCIFSIFDESKFNTSGKEVYGILCDIKETGDNIFGGHFYSAKVYLEINPYEYKVYEGSIGLNKSNVKIGDIVKVKLLDDKIEIMEKVNDKSLVSDNLVLNFNYDFHEEINNDISPDVVIVDGIKYRKSNMR